MNFIKLRTELEDVLAGKHDNLFTEVISKIHCMSTPRVYAVINAVVSCMDDGELYCEVGMYQGGSHISALLGNSAKAIGVDNFAEFQGTNNFDQTYKNLCDFGVAQRTEIRNMGYKEFFAQLPPETKIQVYYYDGAHGYEPQLEGMELGFQFMQSGSVLIVDDLFYPEVTRAVNQFIANHVNQVRVMLMIDSMQAVDPVWWNGVCAIRVL